MKDQAKWQNIHSVVMSALEAKTKTDYIEKMRAGVQEHLAAANPDDQPVLGMAEVDQHHLVTGLNVLPSNWDMWDLITFLGLERFQPKEVQAEAASTDKKSAYARSRSPAGKIVWSNPRQHWLQSQCILPFINRVDPTQVGKADPNDPYDDGTIGPHFHQLHAAAIWFARAFASNPHESIPAATPILADEPGLGKTLILIFVAVLRRHYSLALSADPAYRAPVMAGLPVGDGPVP